MQMPFTLRAAALAALFAVAGCSTITPKEMPSDLKSTAEKAHDAMAADAAWNSAPVTKEGKASIVIMTPMALPASVKARKVQLELEPGATIKDVVAFLGQMGIPIMVSDQAAAEQTFYLPRYNGSLGNLLSAISRSTDIWFSWNDGTILVSSTERISVTVPQDGTFGDALGKGLDSLGIKTKSVLTPAGMVSLDVTPSQYRNVRQYLARMTNNSAFVTLQVAVINVTMNQTAKQGVDWDNLSISALKGGTPLDVQAWQKALGTSSTSSTASTTSTSSTSTSSTSTDSTSTDSTAATGSTSANVAEAVLTGGALQGLIFTKRFNFSGLYNFLQTYGSAETKQNVLLKTVAGNKVEFKSLTKIPYIKSVGVTTTSSTVSSSSLGSTQTENAEDGIQVEMNPTYDASGNTLTIDLKLSIKAVLAMNQLSAGNQIGTLTVPTTADRSVTDIIRMRPGNVTVVGGLTYDSVTNSNGSPLFLQNTSAESQSLVISRTSMFVVVRGNVTRIGQVMEEDENSTDNEYLELVPGQREATDGMAKEPVSAAGKGRKAAAPAERAQPESKPAPSPSKVASATKTERPAGIAPPSATVPVKALPASTPAVPEKPQAAVADKAAATTPAVSAPVAPVPAPAEAAAAAKANTAK